MQTSELRTGKKETELSTHEQIFTVLLMIQTQSQGKCTFFYMRNNAGGIRSCSGALAKHKSNGQISGFGKLENQCVIYPPPPSLQDKALSEREREKKRRNPLMKQTGQRNKPETNIFQQIIITQGTESARENENVILHVKLSLTLCVTFTERNISFCSLQWVHSVEAGTL